MSKFITKIDHVPKITEIEISADSLNSMLIPLGLKQGKQDKYVPANWFV